MDAADYDIPERYFVSSDRGMKYEPFRLAVVLQNLIESERLGIDEYLPAMNTEPFFLVAATGLGKTVVAPPHVWLRQCAKLRKLHPGVLPRVWVVEPRVMIADEQGAYMHETFRKVHQSLGLQGAPGSLFGSISSAKRVRQSAPVLFVTTGIFTLKARAGDFDPHIDRVIIDEAHETIAQNPDVELAIAICRQAGVTIDYMSATVDTESIPDLLGIKPVNIILADKQRHPIFISNVGRTMKDAIVDVARELLIDRNVNSSLLPPLSSPIRSEIIRDLFEGEERSHGLLVAINSVSGATSDAKIVQKKLMEAGLQMGGEPLDVLELSSKQTKNLLEATRFEERLAAIERKHRPYVVVATSVIEMGVTIGSLDYVMTMDSGFENVVVGDRTVPTVVPLAFNSLKQRLGRVGRRRAGIGLITTEVGAPYTKFDSDTLNGDGLEYEPVKTPLATGPLLQLAYYTFEKGWFTAAQVGEGLAAMGLPSRRQLLTIDRLTDLVEERRFLQQLGVAGEDGALTASGRSTGAWIGDGYLPYAVRLQQALAEDTPDSLEILFWTVALACSETTLSNLMRKRVLLDSMFNAPGPYSFCASDIRASNELVGLFQLICHLGATYGSNLDEQQSPLVSLHLAARTNFDGQCEALGMDTLRVDALLSRVQSTISRVPKVNRSSNIDMWPIFGTRQPFGLGDIAWPVLDSIDVDRLARLVHHLPGRPLLQLDREDRKRGDDFVQYWSLGGRRIARAGDATPQLTQNEAGSRRFSGRLQLLREASFDGFWLEVVHHAVIET